MISRFDHPFRATRGDRSSPIVDPVTEESRRAMIELARRESGGTQVALLWSREDARLTVSVVGAGDDASFELDAARGSALDVFYHPYAYAARGHRKDDDD